MMSVTLENLPLKSKHPQVISFSYTAALFGIENGIIFIHFWLHYRNRSSRYGEARHSVLRVVCVELFLMPDGLKAVRSLSLAVLTFSSCSCVRVPVALGSVPHFTQLIVSLRNSVRNPDPRSALNQGCLFYFFFFNFLWSTGRRRKRKLLWL